MSHADHRYIRSKLFYDKRKQGGHGQCLNEDIPVAFIGGVVLLKGDRLEPSSTLKDIGATFDNLVIFPNTVTFWRPSLASVCHHRNPLFSATIGNTHGELIGIDDLHSNALGSFGFLCSFIILMCFRHDIWNTYESTEEGRIAASCECTIEICGHQAKNQRKLMT